MQEKRSKLPKKILRIKTATGEVIYTKDDPIAQRSAKIFEDGFKANLAKEAKARPRKKS